ncbi:MAG: sialate O-acetylesterase [Ruminococcaceae bacterium]|nr:sialate O-acetylesterase [Oscillospiraceae bacterium]
MKKVLSIISVLILALSISVCADKVDYQTLNLFTEGFENSVSISTAGSGSTATINTVSDYVYSGSKSLKITVSNNKNAGAKVKNIFKNIFTTENIGKKYILNAWVYINDNTHTSYDGLTFSAIEASNTNCRYQCINSDLLPGVWTKVTMSFDVTKEDVETEKLNTLRIDMYGTVTSLMAKEFYVDDITVYECDETKTITQKRYTQYKTVDFDNENTSISTYSSNTGNAFGYKLGGGGKPKVEVVKNMPYSNGNSLKFGSRYNNYERIKIGGILPVIDESYIGKQIRISMYVYSDSINKDHHDVLVLSLMHDGESGNQYESRTTLKEGTFVYCELEEIITEEFVEKYKDYPARIGVQTAMRGTTDLYIDDIKVEFTDRAITTNAYFADNMVFQQEKPIKMWGNGYVEGEKVDITFDGETKETFVKDGKWEIEFSPRKAKKGLTVDIKGKTFYNVAIGEVWFCAGQSNMAHTLSQIKVRDFDEIKSDSVNYDIRYLGQDSFGSPAAEVEEFYKAKWVTSNTEEELMQMSATGYLTAYYIAKEIPNVTIGLIDVSVGGTKIESWMSADSIYSRSEYEMYQKQLENHNNGTDVMSETVGVPTSLYNGMYAPIKKAAARGMLWYQGESNANYSSTIENNRTYLYDLKLTDLINQYRRDQNDENFPVVAFMLAPYKTTSSYHMVRQFTLDVSKRLNNVYVISTSNEGPNEFDHSINNAIHPSNKKPIGQRAARAILYNVYGKNEYKIWNGPVYKSMTVKDNKATLTFDLVGDGITTTDGEALKGFEISSDGTTFVPATAVVNGNNVEVYAEGIENPVEVRYCYVIISDDLMTLGGNMTNETNIPAIPFRASVITFDAKKETADNAVTYTVTNTGYNEMDLDLIFALYDEYNNLKEAKVKSVFLPTVGDYDVNCEFEKTVEDTDIVKVFAFDNVLSLIPALSAK